MKTKVAILAFLTIFSQYAFPENLENYKAGYLSGY